MNNVIAMPTQSAKKRHKHDASTPVSGHTKVFPFAADAVGQINEQNRQLAKSVFQKATGFVEAINVIDQDLVPQAVEAVRNFRIWAGFGEYATHRTFISTMLFFAINILIVIGETILSAMTLRGVGLDDTETYIAALASVGVAFLVAKALAYALSWHHHETDPKRKTQAKYMAIAGAASLVVMLAGMVFARQAYADAETQAGNAGFNSVALFGLSALQFALYSCQIVIFYFYLPANPYAERARVNYCTARKKIRKLLLKRAKVASQLNVIVNSYVATHEMQVETGKRLISEYVQGVHRLGKSEFLADFDLTLNDNWFLPLSPQVPKAVDAPPDIVQLVAQGKFSDAADELDEPEEVDDYRLATGTSERKTS